MLLIIKRVKLIKKKKFVITIFNSDYKIFIIYITTSNICFDVDVKVFSLKKAQIAHLKVNNISIKVSDKYTNFKNFFFSKVNNGIYKIYKYQQL